MTHHPEIERIARGLKELHAWASDSRGAILRVLLAGLSLIALLWTHMDQRRKPDESLESEIEYLKGIARTYFNIDLNLHRLDAQLGDIVATKIDDYFFQRFRDWHVHDLMAMREILAAHLAKERKEVAKGKRKASEGKPEPEPAQAPTPSE